MRVTYSMGNKNFVDRVNEILNNNRQFQGYLNKHGMSGRNLY